MLIGTNIDHRTGIRFGAISGHTVPSLVDAIIERGVNVESQAIRDEVEEALNDLLLCLERNFGEKAADIDRKLGISDAVWEYVAEAESCHSIEDSVYKANIDGMELLLTSLGGAPLIIVEKSPKIVRGRLCSPCVPNAVDLDHPCEDGYEGYGIVDDWMRQD